MPKRFGNRRVYAIALYGLAAASVAVLPLPGKMPALARTAAPGRSFRDCSNGCPEMVAVPPGRFTMGAPAGEEERANWPADRRGNSVPQHLVTIRHKFAIGKFDVTRDEYAQFVAETHRPDPDSCITLAASGTFIPTNGNWHSPGFPQTGRDPAVCVGWDDAQAYVSWLSAKTGQAYRLPTEAEWEYAARAGTTTARYFSDNPAEFCRHTNVGDLDYFEQHPGDSGVNRVSPPQPPQSSKPVASPTSSLRRDL
jgi:formylglycine-generating enzyme required for sulfatase activity